MEVLAAAFYHTYTEFIACLFSVGPSRPKIIRPNVYQGLIFPEEKEIADLRLEVICVYLTNIICVLLCNCSST